VHQICTAGASDVGGPTDSPPVWPIFRGDRGQHVKNQIFG